MHPPLSFQIRKSSPVALTKRGCLSVAIALLLSLSLDTNADPLLWRIDTQPPSYLFGTIHSAHPELNQLPPSVENAFNSAQRFYAELALDSKAQQRIQALFLAGEGEHLSDVLSPSRWKRTETLLQRVDPALKLSAWDPFQLWAFTLTLSLLQDRLTYSDAPMMDQRLYLLAEQQQKTTGGLESPSEQAAIFSELSQPEQLQLLDNTLDQLEQSLEAGKAQADEAYQLYQAGEPAAFVALLEQQLTLPLALKKKLISKLLYERNERMAARIDAELRRHQGQSSFFAVGAAHLAEQQGVPQLLEIRGYRVIRVKDQ